MISKELLSEVLGLKVWKVLGNTECILRYCIYPNKGDEPSEYMFPINIYELAYKCKEWAFSKDYHINTSEDKINNYVYLYKMNKNLLGYEIDKSKGVQFDSKGYLINLFEAYEWILKND